MLLITVDTNQLDLGRLAEIRALTYLPHDIACVTVSSRERGLPTVKTATVLETFVWGETRWGEGAWARPLAETFVLGESRLDEGVLGHDTSAALFESALVIISGGSFPGPGNRDDLSRGQARQLRDAMVFEAHAREGRHVLVTDDERGFVRGERRSRLERLGTTKIRTFAEYALASEERRLEVLLPDR